MDVKIFLLAMALLLIPMSSASNHVNVKFYTDILAQNPYCNEFMTVYLQNRTSSPSGLQYDYKCYTSNYTGCVADFDVSDVRTYDLLITDGAVTINNVTGCPTKVENYDIWSTVQSDIYVNHNMNLKYYINITAQGSPKSAFGNSLSISQIFTAFYYLMGFILIAFVQFLLVKNTGNASPILALLMVGMIILLKLILF